MGHCHDDFILDFIICPRRHEPLCTHGHRYVVLASGCSVESSSAMWQRIAAHSRLRLRGKLTNQTWCSEVWHGNQQTEGQAVRMPWALANMIMGSLRVAPCAKIANFEDHKQHLEL